MTVLLPTLLPDVDDTNENFTLVKLLDAALETIIDVYDAAGIPLPERRYWTLGLPAADAEQLVVSLTQLYAGIPNEPIPAPTNCDGPRTFTMAVQILRCLPTVDDRGIAPTAEAIQRASAYQALDMWLILDSLGAIAGGAPALATVDAGQAEGGFQGITGTITQLVL